MGANLLYLWGPTGRGGGELVGGELVMGRNLRNSTKSLEIQTVLYCKTKKPIKLNICKMSSS